MSPALLRNYFVTLANFFAFYAAYRRSLLRAINFSPKILLFTLSRDALSLFVSTIGYEGRTPEIYIFL